jgi:hypothetical protein
LQACPAGTSALHIPPVDPSTADEVPLPPQAASAHKLAQAVPRSPLFHWRATLFIVAADYDSPVPVK